MVFWNLLWCKGFLDRAQVHFVCNELLACPCDFGRAGHGCWERAQRRWRSRDFSWPTVYPTLVHVVIYLLKEEDEIEEASNPAMPDEDDQDIVRNDVSKVYLAWPSAQLLWWTYVWFAFASHLRKSQIKNIGWMNRSPHQRCFASFPSNNAEMI